MGTPAYMAPEQAGGGTKFVGPEADVWALGVMLYELCCGERPIDTAGPLLDALARVANGDVPPLRDEVPGRSARPGADRPQVPGRRPPRPLPDRRRTGD